MKYLFLPLRYYFHCLIIACLVNNKLFASGHNATVVGMKLIVNLMPPFSLLWVDLDQEIHFTTRIGHLPSKNWYSLEFHIRYFIPNCQGQWRVKTRKNLFGI